MKKRRRRSQGRLYDLAAFSARIRSARVAKGMSQDKLAQLAGVSQGTISSIENGYQYDVRLSRALRIAHCLDANIADLVRPTKKKDET